VLSPVVVGMWEPMARALGWPAKPIGWAEVADFAASGAGWSRYGHPEWGAGKTRDLQSSDVDRAAGLVRRVQANVVHYGRSTGFFAEKMFTRGPSYLS